MAYVSKEDKKTLAPAIKKVLAEYGVKGTIKVNHHSTLVVTLRKIPVGMFTDREIENGVNVYHLEWFEGTAKLFLIKFRQISWLAWYYSVMVAIIGQEALKMFLDDSEF